MDTILIQITNQKAIGLLHELEELHLIKVLKQNTGDRLKLSDKYKGILSKEEGISSNNGKIYLKHSLLQQDIMIEKRLIMQ